MFRWEDPNPDSKSSAIRIDWDAVVNDLKSRPGEWALVLENDYIQKARVALMRRGCEVTCRGVGSPSRGKAEKIYARYIEEGEI